MPKLYLFNPENDLALAHGGHNYCAPKNVARLRDLGSFLPFWVASKNDYIFCPQINHDWAHKTCEQFDLQGKIFDSSEYPHDIQPVPWGWSISAVDHFMRIGMPSDYMPDEAAIRRIREISHRHTSVCINRRLGSSGINIPPLPIETSSVQDIDAARQRFGRFIIKAPWSSSGRGIVDSATLADHELKRQAAGIIRHQGGIIIEKHLEKFLDFAMLFTIRDGIVSYKGLSVFFNHRESSYSGNLLAPQDYLLSELTKYVDAGHLNEIQAALTGILQEIIGMDYNGWFGIDMMVYKTNDRDAMIAPCIELNLRMTMGVIALSLSKFFLGENAIGHLKINYGQYRPHNAPVISGHKLIAGSVDLVPPNNYFQFRFETSPISASAINPHKLR